jgi:hypothetical protein
MPAFENGSLWLVLCQRCETQQQQWVSADGDCFKACCACTTVEISGLTQSPNGPVTGCVLYPHKVKGIRPSRRLLAMGSHGRLWRERWRTPTGVILESGEDFVTVFHEDGRQVWSKDFSFSYTLLTGSPWSTPEGGAT